MRVVWGGSNEPAIGRKKSGGCCNYCALHINLQTPHPGLELETFLTLDFTSF